MQINTVLKLFERTMPSLISVTRSSFGNDRENDSNRVQVKDVEYIPMVQEGILQVRANTYSEPGVGPYQSVIVLNGVQFVNEDEYNQANETGENIFNMTSSGGTDFYIQYEPAATVDVRVRCTCEDFRWRFAAYNYSDGSLQGDPPDTYVKKTDRPSVNPADTPGVCKHLIKLKKELERENFFRSVLN